MRNNLNNPVRIDIMGFDIPKHRRRQKIVASKEKKKKKLVFWFVSILKIRKNWFI